MVYSKNIETGEEGYKKVLSISQKQANSYVSVTANNEIINATSEHPFWVNGIWKNAGELLKGDILTQPQIQSLVASNAPFLARSGLNVENLSFTDSLVDVYNVEVDDFHTYFVGKNEILVHNANCGKPNLIKKTDPNGWDELEVTTYKKGRTPGGDNLTPHHSPAKAYIKGLQQNHPQLYTKYKTFIDKYILEKGDNAICIMLEHTGTGTGTRHGRTFNYGGSANNPADLALSPRKYLDKDLDGLRQIYMDDGLYTNFVESAILDYEKRVIASFPDGFFDF